MRVAPDKSHEEGRTVLRKIATILAVLVILGVLCRFTALSEDRVV